MAKILYVEEHITRGSDLSHKLEHRLSTLITNATGLSEADAARVRR